MDTKVFKGHREPCVASRDKIEFLYAGRHPANKMTHNIYCILPLHNEYVNEKTTTFSNFFTFYLITLTICKKLSAEFSAESFI